MFMSKDELSDDEEMGGGDVVVPLSLVASTPQVINASSLRGEKAGEEPTL